MSAVTKRINGKLYFIDKGGLTHKEAVNIAAATKRNIANWDRGRGRSGHRVSVRAYPYEGKWATWISE